MKTQGTETTRKRSPLNALLLSLALSVGTIGLAACNTVEGFGEDMQAAGEGIENEAQEAQ
ncbi:entericidin A/B family lipoprotein [Caenispirillum bisanense]|uniref:entericidin A/B family lipoprotein n=1 Tax=Caenispirillum bisanense TaxID=414052 RepID=UPI0031DBEF22